MAAKVLSMEIGQGLTRVVEMDYLAKSPKVYNCFSFETPPGVILDGVVTANESFTTKLRDECQKRGIRTNSVVFSVTSTRIASREIRIPQVKEKQIRTTILSNAGDYFPVDMTQYQLIPGKAEKVEGESGKQWKLNLMAVPNDLIKNYQDFADSCGLQLLAMDYVGNSIYQVMKAALTTGTNAVLKVDERTTLISIMKEGNVVFQRIVAYGIEEAVEALQNMGTYGEDLSYGEAVRVLCGRTCIKDYLGSEDEAWPEENEYQEEKTTVTESLRYTISGISRVLEYYLSSHDGDTFDSVSLVGLGADFSGLSKLLTNELNHPVRVFTNLQNTNMGRTLDDQYLSVAAYAACIGAALENVNLISPEMMSKGRKSGRKGRMRETVILAGASVLAVGVIGSAAMASVSLAKYVSAKNERAAIEEHILQLRAAGVETVYQEYLNVSGLNSSLKEVYGMTRSRNEDLVEFITELEQKLPSTDVVLNFTATRTGVTMSCECADKEAAAMTLMQLRTFDSVEVVSSSGLQDSDNLKGDSADAKVSFTVDCVYLPVDMEPETAQDVPTALPETAPAEAAQ